MKMNCDVISDLLPLYAEDMVTEASKELVEEHMKECESCRKKREGLSASIPVPAQTDRGMESVRKEILRRRWLAVGLAVLMLCSIGCMVLNWLTSPIYLDESIITSIEEDDSGIVWFTLDAAAVGEETFQYEVEPTPAGETITAWTSHWLRMKWNEPEPRKITVLGNVMHNGIYYFTGRDGEEDLLIYENPEKYVNGGVMTLPRLFLSYYFMMAIGIGCVLLLLALLLRRKRAGKMLAGFGSFFWCYALCQGVICGFSFASFFAQQEFAWGIAMTVFTWGAGLCAWKLRKRK